MKVIKAILEGADPRSVLTEGISGNVKVVIEGKTFARDVYVEIPGEKDYDRGDDARDALADEIDGGEYIADTFTNIMKFNKELVIEFDKNGRVAKAYLR